MSEYTILEKLGEGGMGQVYRACQTQLNRMVALKTLAADQAHDESLRQRFRREARLLCSLSHPHIVPVFDSGNLAGRPYFVMELIEGTSLAETVLVEGAVTPARALFWMRQLVEALVYLHERGIQHRDIKPRNVILTRRGGQEHLVLVDFGLAKTAASRNLTAAGEVVGTLSYLAPEVIETTTGSTPQDIWAVALTTIETLIGKPLFSAPIPAQVAVQVLDFDPATLEEILPETLPDWVKDMLIACMAHDPLARPAARDIRQLLDEKGVGGVLTTAAYLEVAKAAAAPPPGSSFTVTSPGALPLKPILAFLSGGLAVLLIALASLASGPRPVTPVTPASGTPAAPSSPGPARTSPPPPLVRDLVTFASERSVLVDFDFPPGQELTVTLSQRGVASRRVALHRPAQLRWFHQLFENLQADSLHDLRVEVTGGPVVLEGYPVRTHPREVRGLRESGQRGLDESFYVEAAMIAVQQFADPEVLPPLVKLVEGGPPSGHSVKQLLAIARLFREPALAELLIERTGPAWGDIVERQALLEAAAAARCVSAMPLAHAWFAENHQSWNICQGATLLFGVEGKKESGERIIQRVETLPGWMQVPHLEALISCDREQARWAFHRWLEGPMAAGDLSREAIRGLLALGDAQDRSWLRALLDPTRPGANSNDAAVLIADAPGPEDVTSLTRWLREGTPDPGALWAAARAGSWQPVIPPAVKDAAGRFAWETSRVLTKPPLHTEIVAEISRLSIASSPSREVSAWVLHAWRSSDAAPALERIALEGGEEAAVVAWCRAGLPGAPPAAAFIDLCLAQAGDEKVPALRRMLFLAALSRSNPEHFEGLLQVLSRSRGTPKPLQDLASVLDPRRPGAGSSRTSTHLLLGPYQKVGIRLKRGESVQVRGWGVVEAAAGKDGLAYLPEDDGPLAPGPSLEVALRMGSVEWPVVNRWGTALAREDVELLLATCRRQHPDRDVLPAGAVHGMAVLEIRTK